jgi:hypothetical protein
MVQYQGHIIRTLSVPLLSNAISTHNDGRGNRDRQTRLGSELPSRQTLAQSGLTSPESTSKIGMAIVDPHLSGTPSLLIFGTSTEEIDVSLLLFHQQNLVSTKLVQAEH